MLNWQRQDFFSEQKAKEAKRRNGEEEEKKVNGKTRRERERQRERKTGKHGRDLPRPFEAAYLWLVGQHPDDGKYRKRRVRIGNFMTQVTL